MLSFESYTKSMLTHSFYVQVMELMDFGSLWDLLHNPTFPLRAKSALRVLRDVAQGMRFLHSAEPQVCPRCELSSVGRTVQAICAF